LQIFDTAADAHAAPIVRNEPTKFIDKPTFTDSGFTRDDRGRPAAGTGGGKPLLEKIQFGEAGNKTGRDG
jgi:hypothetical protein